MLTKLSLNGIKSRFKEYVVLFSGLIMASAIFYMFEALATNKSFVKANSIISMASIVFQFGSVLLGIIAFVYVLYANTFLMSMRQRDYGTFMMLGAKRHKISQLIFAETFLIGFGSTVIGILIGTGLTAGLSGLLLKQMDITVAHFHAFYLPAVGVTMLFFAVLFLLAALLNCRKLLKTPLLQLLHDDKQPTRVQKAGRGQVIKSILGLVLVAIGYYAMAHLEQLQINAIPIALVTIVFGTYFLFDAVFISLLQLLKRNPTFAFHRLNDFTLAQLNFRIRSYTKVLSMVAILFAMALGAITVGIGYQREIPLVTKTVSAYDVLVQNPTAQEKKLLNQMKLSQDLTLSYKTDAKNVYFDQNDLDAQTVETMYHAKNQYNQTHVQSTTTAELQKNPGLLSEFAGAVNSNKMPQIVSHAQFQKMTAPTETVRAVHSQNFNQSLPTLKQIQKLQVAQLPAGMNAFQMGGRLSSYQTAKALFGGMEFMGLFLGIAFLAMLASCLMFKILSGAANDKQRYQMLAKIGTRRSWLQHSIRVEILTLFALPGIAGIIHVLFGLQMFTLIMDAPYADLWIPFSLFIVLYALYYILTVVLYQRIVLPKQHD
ncbi:hypothetical protein IV38_GL001650 [Lactobacillus selangorensis]|uniref:ABC3 transporter permease C-terminal domain-containing protein n=1 Tax=Lactobacillus selangorensis TaxID=81857 RepID=A0A0R2FR00_9LACO|nr:ABC transporter permease [Lactobacillus selangorensis]KRN28197.1 hypothetical protein IV38_GL001650 [Lactobacillus selangorensis]KRN30927.1 hypothetical protein IV40_GL001565 [Lactobacillus selangorensis]